MSANINFFAGQNFLIQNLSGSGVGFYGSAGFGASVPVGSYQDHSFITDGNGVNQGAEIANVKYLNAGSGILGQTGSGIALTAIPNYQATLNIEFTYDTPVQAQIVQLYIYDRVANLNPASGVTTQVAEVIHPNITQANIGSGSTLWTTFTQATGQVLSLSNSPGISGQYAGNGTNSTRPDTQHDWYVALSASPNSIGSKTQYGLYVSLQYL